VREVLEHGKTGLLVDFFDPAALARQVTEVLANPADHAELGRARRHHVVETYDFHTRALPTHVARINDLVAAKAGCHWAEPLPTPGQDVRKMPGFALKHRLAMPYGLTQRQTRHPRRDGRHAQGTGMAAAAYSSDRWRGLYRLAHVSGPRRRGS
jgi:hypothetical protein